MREAERRYGAGCGRAEPLLATTVGTAPAISPERFVFGKGGSTVHTIQVVRRAMCANRPRRCRSRAATSDHRRGHCEGHERPYPDAVAAEFLRKFDWDLDSEPEYDVLIEVVPTRWLRW